LTRADCDLFKGRFTTVTVNNGVYWAPWADYLYSGDERWWRKHAPNVVWFRGERITHQPFEDIRQFNGSPKFARFGGNSGIQAVQWSAAECKAPGIALLGFDHKYQGKGKNVKRHCHGDHPKPLTNAMTIDSWPQLMARTAEDLERMGVPVLNLTRDTALTCFEQMSLEDFIAQT
jgi:hypothetical protein